MGTVAAAMIVTSYEQYLADCCTATMMLTACQCHAAWAWREPRPQSACGEVRRWCLRLPVRCSRRAAPRLSDAVKVSLWHAVARCHES
eukprot:3576339-Rhodomonas_salina.1